MFIICLLSVTAVAGLRGAFNGWGFMVPAVVAVAGAASMTLAARWWRLYVGESVAISLLLFLAVGGPAVAGLPTPDAYTTFGRGLAHGWADLLSSTPPADLTAELRVLPYAIGWLSVLLGGELFRRFRYPLVAVAGPALGLVVTLLLTVENRGIALVQGTALALGALLLTVIHQWFLAAHRAGDDTSTTRSGPQTTAWTVGLLAFIIVSAPLLGPRLPFANANDRFDLRQYQDRPWDPLSLPSPLVTLKASLKEGRSEAVVFRVEADEAITRWSLAVLGDYNGVVWTVADEHGDAPAAFRPVDSQLPEPPSDISQGTGAGASVTNYSIEVGDLDGVWVPVAGYPRSVTRHGDDTTPLRLNQATGTLAAPTGLISGEVLEATSIVRPELDDIGLLRATAVSNDDDAELTLVPPRVRNLAGDLFEGTGAGTARAVALANVFALEGFYDHGEQARPGHSLARIDEFLEDPDRLVGFAEQYAAAAAVLGRVGGLPTRVVVGYQIPVERYVDGRADVFGNDVTAWVEIETVEHGWVPITVTPDRSREPEADQLGVSIKDVAIPNPPPPPPPPPERNPPAQSVDDDTDPEEDDEDDRSDAEESIVAGVPTPVLMATTAMGGPLLLLGLGAAVVVSLKTLRRRRRRNLSQPRQQIIGAWQEVIDRFAEAGSPVDNGATPTETVRQLLDSPSAIDASKPGNSSNPVDDSRRELHALAEQVDRAVYHPTGPDDEAAAKAWAHCDRTVAALRRRHRRWQRACMATDPRPLFKTSLDKQHSPDKPPSPDKPSRPKERS